MTTLSPEVLALIAAAQSASSAATATVGFSFGLIEYANNNRTSRSGKPKVVTPIRGDYFTSNCPLITANGKTSTVEEANSWLGQLAEYSEAEGGILDITVVFDFKTLASIQKRMQAEKMTYGTVTLSKVTGIHKRVATNKNGETITALTIDLFDRDNIEVKPAANPMAANAEYCSDDNKWLMAVATSAKAKRAGMNKWLQVQNAKQQQEGASQQVVEDNLDKLLDEEETPTSTTA